MRSLDSNVLFSVREYHSTAFHGRRLPILLCSLIAIFLTLIQPSLSLSETWTVRDRAGKVIEKKVPTGDRVKVYDPSGRLLRVEKISGNRTDIRDRTGRLIEKKVIKGDEVWIYDRSGKLLRKEKRHGPRTVVRDRSGKTLEKKTQRGNRTTVRDSRGRLNQVETQR